MTETDFLVEYIFVVLNASMKNWVAAKIFRRFMEKLDFDMIGHESKRKAIIEASLKYRGWFVSLQRAPDKLAFLETLPWIGEATKYRLVRNLGIDVAKPDRHLLRVARRFGYNDVQEMRRELSEVTGDRVGVVDLALWRACEQGIMRLG